MTRVLRLRELSMDKHYQFVYKGIKLDPYRILEVYGIANPAQQHAVKKLLRAGRSVKTTVQDIDEVILSLQRWKEMIREDAEPTTPFSDIVPMPGIPPSKIVRPGHE
jgi:hypothetical protein